MPRPQLALDHASVPVERQLCPFGVGFGAFDLAEQADHRGVAGGAPVNTQLVLAQDGGNALGIICELALNED